MFHAGPAAGYADLRTPVCGVDQAGWATHGAASLASQAATWSARSWPAGGPNAGASGSPGTPGLAGR